MNSESERAQAFIGRLLQNPTLNGFTSLQKEEHIIQFLHGNAAQLAPTLGSDQFFPGKSWNQIFSFLLTTLYEVINRDLYSEIDRIVHDQIDFTFVHLLRRQQIDTQKIADQTTQLTKRMLEKPDVRRAFTGAFTALQSGVSDRYVDEVFARKTYIHFELTKVQRLRIGKEEIRNYIDCNLLLKPTVSMVSSSTQNQTERATGMVQNQFAEKVLDTLKRDLKLLPEAVLKSVVHASVSFNDNRFIEATARIAAILAARSRHYQPNMKVDRGADNPDTSWLSTARRNYKFYGFDIKMLDEMYKIAAENGW